jgi:hypothetical protein
MAKRTRIVSVVWIGLMSAPAFADKVAPEWKPAPEMKQLEGLLGTWSCDGYENGKVTGHATTINAVDFGGAWIRITFDADASPGTAPTGSHGEMGWDPEAKKFVFFAAHGEGSWQVSMSPGLDKGRLAFTPLSPRPDPDRRSVFVWKDRQHVDIFHEQRTGKTWKSVLGESCTLK